MYAWCNWQFRKHTVHDYMMCQFAFCACFYLAPGTAWAERPVMERDYIYSLLFAIWYTLWQFNIAMEYGPFIDGLPIKNGDFPWRTGSHNQMVYICLFVIFMKCISPSCGPESDGFPSIFHSERLVANATVFQVIETYRTWQVASGAVEPVLLLADKPRVWVAQQSISTWWAPSRYWIHFQHPWFTIESIHFGGKNNDYQGKGLRPNGCQCNRQPIIVAAHPQIDEWKNT